MARGPLRVAVFTQQALGDGDALSRSFARLHHVVSRWAGRHGHRIVVVVCPDDPGYGPAAGARPHFSGAPVVRARRKGPSVAAALASSAPDVLLSVGYPWLISEEVAALPPLGAVNLHPSALPLGRGPNPARLIYEGATTMGATLHRLAPAYDTGPVLSRIVRPLPEPLNGPALLEGWAGLLGLALEEGASDLLAGVPGIAQNEADASSCPLFTRQECLLTATGTTAGLLRKAAALNVFMSTAAIRVDGAVARVANLSETSAGTAGTVSGAATGAPGEILARHADGWTLRTADGAVRVETLH